MGKTTRAASKMYRAGRSAASTAKRKIRGNSTDPWARTWWRGHKTDNRTVSAAEWAEKRYLARGRNRQKWRVGQGSWANGSMSAGTHSGGSALDIMFAGVNKKQRKAIVKWARKAGFAAWPREGAAWGTNNDHAHLILLPTGKGKTNASNGAKDQQRSYLAGRDGLAGDGPDTSPRPKPIPRWSHKRNKPYVPKG